MPPRVERQTPRTEQQNGADRIYGYLAVRGAEAHGPHPAPLTINLEMVQPDLKIGNAIISIN